MDKLKAIFEYQCYRQFLQDDLSLAKSRNSAFSLRAYAQKIGLTPSYLSEVIGGKKNLSLDKAAQIAHKLQLNEKEKEFFLQLVQANNSKHDSASQILIGGLKKFHRPVVRDNANSKQFEMLSKWYFIPVLEMIVSPQYTKKPLEIAHILGIAPSQVADAILVLLELNIIEELGEDGGFKKTHGHMILSSDNHNKALKKFHSALLEKYQRALYDQTPQERYTGSETLLIDPAQIAEANKIMNECLDRLVLLFNQGQNRTEPYHLHFGMFSLKRKTVSGNEEAS